MTSTREIKNSGFDLLLPGEGNASRAPLQPQKSGRSRKTPQPDLLHQKSGRSRKTPQRDLPPQRSTRRTPAPDEAQQQPSSKSIPASSNPRKRGRPKTILEIDEDGAKGRAEEEAPVKRRKTQSQPRSKKKADDINALQSFDPSEVQVKDSQVTEPKQTVVGEKKRKRKRKSIGQQSIRKGRPAAKSPLEPKGQRQKRAPESQLAQQVEPVIPQTPEPPEYSRITTPALRDRELSQVQSLVHAADKETDRPTVEESPDKNMVEPTTKKRKRKNEARNDVSRQGESLPHNEKNLEAVTVEARPAEQVQTKVKRGRKPGKRKQNPHEALHIPSAPKGPSETGQALEVTTGDVEGASNSATRDAEPPVDDQSSLAKPKARKRKRKSIGQQSLRPRKAQKSSTTRKKAANKNDAARDAVNEEQASSSNALLENEEGHEPFIETKKKRGRPRKDAAAPPTQPHTKKSSKPRIQKQKPNKKETSLPKPARKPPKNSIPIAYYAPPSPPSDSPDHPETDIDPLSDPSIKLPPPKGINAVDVLAQVCSEIIDKTSTQLLSKPHSESPQHRAKLKRQQETIEIYGEELRDNLFHLSRALNENIAVGARQRKLLVQERKLRKEVKALEAERERVRKRNEEILREGKVRKLEDMLSGIGDAVKRGWEMEKNGESAGEDAAGDGVED